MLTMPWFDASRSDTALPSKAKLSHCLRVILCVMGQAREWCSLNIDFQSAGAHCIVVITSLSQGHKEARRMKRPLYCVLPTRASSRSSVFMVWHYVRSSTQSASIPILVSFVYTS